MDLDRQVAKLKVLKQSYLSEHYDLEYRILKHYPQEIKDYEERITAYGNDAEIAKLPARLEAARPERRKTSHSLKQRKRK